MLHDWYGDGPICLALIICHDVIEDKRSGNKTLVNLFNAVGAASLPATQQRMTVMTTITNARRQTPLQLVVRTPSGEEEASASGIIQPIAEGESVDVLFELHGMQVREFGTYQVELTSAGERLAMRQFRTIPVTPS